jgi:hypothetical protein
VDPSIELEPINETQEGVMAIPRPIALLLIAALTAARPYPPGVVRVVSR